MSKPKLAVSVSENTNPFYAILERSTSPHSPSSSESSAATEMSTDAGGTSEYLWKPPPPDPKYWDHIAKAQQIRSDVSELKQSLKAKQQGSQEFTKISRELRARERKLMRFIDHHVLNYDDVLSKPKATAAKTVISRNMELGTISPPISPNIGPNRPLPPLPPGAEQKMQQKQKANPLPPTPPELAARNRQRSGTALDSQGFINSYKKNTQLATSPEEPAEKPRGRLLWAGIFGSKNVKPVDTGRRRSESAEGAQLNQPSRLATMASVPSLAQTNGRNGTARIYAL
ncbi:hypothetical protein LPJ78_001059 [Coemansia sp. RSA 989]|nr:hypothetical protein LPJ68_001568 [Coemansia sp. RSA 1086]KAJ1752234.1 hypothetical protein LPJ79_001422 [Coemansia sp. RSA 1821]KAJ1867377.1 hypothetical protein LPJ78_001059 [Coemansia sp. RSA 989]KAJ1873777.1 hypothetical protein LPJ55_002012 [Coemansia sp. RSA 990]KAJ2627946.1 hypothetical protein H4R22_004148 [Coemansia sp. RSA 1290]KAJ2649278.1 hypothetical protein IWW40_003266 [Coemansia sp. RSA 1250]KAJ2671985.1 hypothetical protein IWW42_003074 [Coemansia sp. RSA 1085]